MAERYQLSLVCLLPLLFSFIQNADGQASGCGNPSGVSNAYIVSSSPYAHGSYVTYACNSGYTMTGSASNVLCNNGAWTGTYPICYQDCAFQSVSNSYTSTSAPYNHGDTVTYVCSSGYSMFTAGGSLTCNHGSWVGTFPNCYQSCGTPSSVSGGTIMSASPFLHLSYVTYQCNSGYTMTGPASNVQCSHGSWSGTYPQCYLNCPTPTYVAHSTITNGKTTYVHTDVATFQCDTGYSMFTGGPSITCNHGSWVGTYPDCYKDCPNPSAISWGDILTSPTYKHLDTLTYACWTGWTMVGAASSTCNHGVFSDSAPDCMWNCSKEHPEGAANGGIISTWPYMHDDLITYRCMPDFYMTGAPSRRCENGTWSGTIPTCEYINVTAVTNQTLTIYTPLTIAEEEMKSNFMALMWGLCGGFFFLMAALLGLGIFVMVTRLRVCERVMEPEPILKEPPPPEPRLADKVLQEVYVPKPVTHGKPFKPFGAKAPVQTHPGFLLETADTPARKVDKVKEMIAEENFKKERKWRTAKKHNVHVRAEPGFIE